MSDDEAEIRELLEDMVAGYRAKDAERVVAHYSPEIVTYTLAPPLQARRGDVLDIGGGRTADLTTVDGVRTWMSGFGDAPFDYAVEDVHVAVDGEVGYAHGLARMGSPGVFTLWFRLTAGLRKHDGEWRLAHVHTSTPFYMDETMKAAVDLQP